jgi:hypothetical protein
MTSPPARSPRALFGGSDEAAARAAAFGPNALDAAAKKPLWKQIAEQFEDRLVQVGVPHRCNHGVA